jgi:hypothetical protein
MSRCKKSAGHAQPSDEFSRESYSGEQLLALLFILHPGIWYTVKNCEEHLKRCGRRLRRGTIYNLLWMLKQRGVIETDGGIPVRRYRLLQKRSESHPIGGHRRGKFGPLVIKLGFLDYLKTLPFEDVRRIHDIRLWTPIGKVDFADKKWKYVKTQRVYCRRERVDEKYRFVFRAYEKARTLEVCLACTNAPIAVDIAGLNRLYSVLCSVRARFLNSQSVPHAGDWILKQWHFGKDAKNTIAGMSFETTWHDFHGDLVRVYTSKSVDSKVRVERIESPNEFVAMLLDSPNDTIKKMMTGEITTCVADDLRMIRADFAWKMSTEGLVSDAPDTDAFLLTQSLHV